MNIFRPQLKYTFCPPKYSRWLAPIFTALSKRFYLCRHFKICDIRVSGEDAVKACMRDGSSILIAPNHADHADPHVLLQAGRVCNSRFHFMAAREGFEESPLNRFVLQRVGAFSVDREGADLSAIKTAIQILEDARFPLVIFPEGEIWHHHETLDEVNEGLASMLLKAYNRGKGEKDAVLVPTGLRYYYDSDIEKTFESRLAKLEESINWTSRPDMSPVDRIVRLCAGLLATKEVEYLGANLTGPLLDRLKAFQIALVSRVESSLGETAGEVGPIPSRVKKARQKIRKQLADVEQVLTDKESAALYQSLDELYLAIQLYSYPGQYLLEEPSVDRIAETLLKLEEDVLGKGSYPSSRRVDVRFGTPISLKSFLDQSGLTAKTAVGALTETMARQIQDLLDLEHAPN